MEYLLGYLFIFGARILDVSISVVRTLLMVRGKKYQAAFIGMIEMFIYISILTKIMSQLDNLGNLVAYSLGFGTGQIVGIYIEEKMALGHVTLQVVAKDDETKLLETLREEGFGVTVIEGYGKDGIRHILNIGLKRNMLPKITRIIEECDKDAFVTILDAKHIQGGYLQRIKRK